VLGVSLKHVLERANCHQLLRSAWGKSATERVSVLDALNLLTEFRNDQSHDNFELAKARHLAPLVVPAVAELLEQLPLFATETLLLARVVSKESEGLRATFVRMHGPEHFMPYPEGRISPAFGDLSVGRLFLVRTSTEIVPLYPLIVSVEEKFYWAYKEVYLGREAVSGGGQDVEKARQDLDALKASWKQGRAHTASTGVPPTTASASPPLDLTGYLNATGLGRELAEQLTPGGVRLLREVLNKSDPRGPIGGGIVHTLLQDIGFLEKRDGVWHITAAAGELARETTSIRHGQSVRVIYWNREVLKRLVNEVRKRIGDSAMDAIQANTIPDYDAVGGMTGRRALDEQLNDYLAEVTDLARAAVTRRLNEASGGQHVRNTFADCYDSLDALAHLTASRARELRLEGALARLTGRRPQWIAQRLGVAPPATRLGALFPSE